VANAGLDVNFFDNGAPGAESLTWDAIDAVTNDARLEFVHADAYFDDNSRIILGTGATAAGDMTINYTAANVLEIKQVVAGGGADGTGSVSMGVSGDGVDVTFFGEEVGDYMVWDQRRAGGANEPALRFVGAPDLVGDSDFNLIIGTTDTETPANGVRFTGAATALGINGVAAGATVTFGGVSDTDVVLTGAASTVTWNHGDNEMTFNGGYLTLEQGDPLVFGDGAANNGDVAIAFETSAAFPAADVLHIKPAAGAAAADQVVQFGTDGAANNVNVYFTSGTAGDGLMWNNSMTSLVFTDATAAFGDGADNSDAIIFGDDIDFSVYYDNEDNALVFDPAGGGGNEINFGDEDSAHYTDILWHAGSGASVMFDDDVDPGSPVLPAALYTAVVTNFDRNSPLHFDVSDQDTPADGFGIDGDSSGGTDELTIGAYAGGVLRIGYINGAAADTDTYFYSAGTVGNVGLIWNYGTDQLQFQSSAGSWYADNAYMSWGNVAATPDMKLSWDATKLLMDTGAAANATFQLGTAAANHQVTTVFGDPATKGITVNPNIATAGRQIAYNTVFPTQRIFIPAASFGPGDSSTVATWGKESNAAGWLLDDSHDICVQTLWQPDLWVHGTAIATRALWSPATNGNVYLQQESFQITPGTTLSTATDATPDAELLSVSAQTIGHNPDGQRWEIPLGEVSSTGWKPIFIQVCRQASSKATDDTMVGNLAFMGLEMEVIRSYGD
jgi:hypothetical protein